MHLPLLLISLHSHHSLLSIGMFVQIMHGGLAIQADEIAMTVPADRTERAEAREAEANAAQALLIRLDEKGSIHVGSGKTKEAMDSDPQSREFPLLEKKIKEYVTKAKAAGQKPKVQLNADQNTKHQRVVDILNLLAKYEISSVTFVNQVEVPEAQAADKQNQN